MSLLHRRTILKGVTALATAPLLSAPYIARAQSGPLVINSYGGAFEAFMRDVIVPDFQAATGIATQLDIGLATNWLANCRAAGPDRAPYDVLMLNAIWAALLQTEGFFEPLPAEKIPNMADLYDVARYEGDTSVVGWYQPMGLAYSDADITPPTSWKSLWNNEDLAGKIGLYTVTNTAGMMFLMMAGKIFGSSSQDFDAAFDHIKKLRPFMQIDFSGTMETMLARGEIATGPLDYATVARLQKGGSPIKAAVPEEGSFAFDQVFSVLGNSTKKEQAYQWIDFILSPENQTKWMRDFFVSPCNRKVSVPDDLAPLIPIAGEKMNQIVRFDWVSANSRRDQTISRWNREMA